MGDSCNGCTANLQQLCGAIKPTLTKISGIFFGTVGIKAFWSEFVTCPFDLPEKLIPTLRKSENVSHFSTFRMSSALFIKILCHYSCLFSYSIYVIWPIYIPYLYHNKVKKRKKRKIQIRKYS